MLKRFRCDLHIHTCLSPCGDLKMSPSAVVRSAAERGVGLIAVCDHNSAENAAAVIRAGRDAGVAVLAGMEVNSREEVHICALFGGVDDALKLQSLVYDNLEGENDERAFGSQVVVDAEGWVLGYNRRLLIGATALSVDEVVGAIHGLGGLAVAAHIDREGYGIIGQLGFIPPDLGLDALEVSHRLSLEEARARFGEYADYPMLRGSDAHRPDEIGRGTTTLMLEAPTFAELRMALRGERGRSIPIDRDGD